MADGKQSHNWDLFALLICYVANPYMRRGKSLKFKDVHPYYKKQIAAERYVTEKEFREWLYG